MSQIKRLTKEEAEKIIAARHAKVRRARAKLMNRLEAEAQQMMQGQQGQDYVPDESEELQLAEKLIAAYVDDVPSGEASFAELQELLQASVIHPRLVMAVSKRLLKGPEYEKDDA